MSSSPGVPLQDTSQDVLPITVRFTNSYDLLLDIPDPNQTSIIALKHAARQKLDSSLAQHRLRLIYRGKLLKDDDILSEVLDIPPAPLPIQDPSGKGKTVETLPERVYINCSIGDVLTPTELAAEAKAATFSTHKSHGRVKRQTGYSGSNPEKTTTASPRGFDRLLSGGFTVAEVNQLRLQFRSIQQSIHTPDTMPSPSTLLRIEDAWIDDNARGGANVSGFDFGDDVFGGGAIDDMLWGNLIGFFWPLGCVGFFMRENGVWSRRRKIAIFTGFILNMAFGILTSMS
ncbi:DSC E3 ubiquitin ligase complex subunit 3 [Golovinomyces cichoracearum]|uniref:DSC E3 ubiquitin ligase complex subunit 3 n=1 Tax=Golovinomyces cichoracearum TaxID=62708 RepID=A0A420IQR7_9PEZI|nr:DSC E3 ubiquitin ligase complex subunit 3 [Golovinomyces cichoracearum]